jgi:hypothetical protein
MLNLHAEIISTIPLIYKMTEDSILVVPLNQKDFKVILLINNGYHKIILMPTIMLPYPRVLLMKEAYALVILLEMLHI